MSANSSSEGSGLEGEGGGRGEKFPNSQQRNSKAKRPESPSFARKCHKIEFIVKWRERKQRERGEKKQKRRIWKTSDRVRPLDLPDRLVPIQAKGNRI